MADEINEGRSTRSPGIKPTITKRGALSYTSTQLLVMAFSNYLEYFSMLSHEERHSPTAVDYK